jgi:hypothetical protein
MEAGITDHVWNIEELVDLAGANRTQPSDEPIPAHAPRALRRLARADGTRTCVRGFILAFFAKPLQD